MDPKLRLPSVRDQTPLFLRNSFTALCLVFLNSAALACESSQTIRLLKPVNISAELKAEAAALPPLRVLAVDAPPLAHYNEKTKTYTGVGIDIFCFIAKELGLRFEVEAGRDQTVLEKIQQVQNGQADVFIPLSHSEARAKLGLFTEPYYYSHYAVIARTDRNITINNSDDLTKYAVGFVKGVSFQPILESLIPPAQLHAYDQTTSNGLFQAVQDGEVDVAVFNQEIFIEKRYNQEFLNIDIIYTLYEHQREYGYYFSQKPENQRLVEAFDRYLIAIDTSEALRTHIQAERNFLERYQEQRRQRLILFIIAAVTLLTSFVTYLGLLRYRRVSKRMAQASIELQQQQLALQNAYEKIKTLSETDSLTGLSNRRHFDTQFNYAYQHYQRTGQPLSLLIIDADHFKCVNDHYGHATGDQYLREVANVLKHSVIRSTDLAARHGGEEFSCLLNNTTSENAYQIAERIRQKVVDLNLPNTTATPPQLTLSIGIVTVISGNPGTTEMFSQADAQLYIAKNNGRNQVRATTLEQ